MNKLYTTHAAIKYLREQTGAMSLKIFTQEVEQGRIPVKPYGNTIRFRKEDLDKWQTITRIAHTDYTNETASGTRAYRSSLATEELSFAKVLAQEKPQMRKIGA